jgi:hypothetical protein
MRWCVDVVMIVVDALMILAVAVWTVREASWKFRRFLFKVGRLSTEDTATREQSERKYFEGFVLNDF